ncbi:hypothetical protein ABAC460_14580 [Asticcacaulis sp. AC460]|nr:hypothetical protein ABAC460_14580 [Asticcacaulis sp. AC460]
MEKQRYTVVCDVRGGTYVSQVQAADEVEAVRLWAAQLLAEKPVPEVSSEVARNVLKTLVRDPPVALTGLVGVWCFTALVGDNLVLGNIVLSA